MDNTDFPLEIPDVVFLTKVGLVVFLVAEFEGQLKTDLVRFLPVLPPELNVYAEKGYGLEAMTTRQLGQYLVAHAPKCSSPQVAEYYRVGGEALIEIAPKRNAMLHSQPAVDGHDPEGKLRLMRWGGGRKTYEPSRMISDEWLDDVTRLIQTLRHQP